MQIDRTRHIIPFVGFSTLHFCLSYGSLFIVGGIVMAAFDGQGSATLAKVASVGMSILLLPIVTGIRDIVPGTRELGTLGAYALFLINSMIWGAAGTVLLSRWRGRRTSAGGT